jgi:hypothetical protein
MMLQRKDLKASFMKKLKSKTDLAKREDPIDDYLESLSDPEGLVQLVGLIEGNIESDWVEIERLKKLGHKISSDDQQYLNELLEKCKTLTDQVEVLKVQYKELTGKKMPI